MNYSITPVGGQDEIGKNMYLITIGDDMYIVECGIKFPDYGALGVDHLIPNVDFLKENKDRIKAIFISHAHEEVSGALPYIADLFNVPIYAPQMVCNLYEKRIKNKNNLNPITRNGNKKFKFNDLEIEYIKVSHNIPETYMIVFKTKDGNIIYSSDFVFDPNTTIEYDFDYKSLLNLTTQTNLAVLANSRQSDINMNTNYVSYLIKEIEEAFKHETGKIILTIHFEDLQMINAIVNKASKHNKKVVIYGIKTKRLIDACSKEGLFKYPKGSLISIEQAKTLNPKDIVIINTGDSGDPFQTLANMGERIDKNFAIEDTDYVMITIPITPQLEKSYSSTMDAIYKTNSTIRKLDKQRVVESYPGSEDLKILYKMLKPKHIIPINGEYRQLHEHFNIVNDIHMNSDVVKILDNGTSFGFNKEKALGVTRLFKSKDIYVDASDMGDINNSIINDREVLAENGVLIAQVNVSKKTKLMEGDILITSRGYIDKTREAKISADLNVIIRDLVEKNTKKELKKTKEEIRSKIMNILNRRVKQVPLILTIINEV